MTLSKKTLGDATQKSPCRAHAARAKCVQITYPKTISHSKYSQSFKLTSRRLYFKGVLIQTMYVAPNCYMIKMLSLYLHFQKLIVDGITCNVDFTSRKQKKLSCKCKNFFERPVTHQKFCSVDQNHIWGVQTTPHM